MNRILYSCLVLFFLVSNNKLLGQGNYSISPNPQCYSPSGVYTASAAIQAPQPGANTYSWTITTSSGTCTPTLSAFTTGTLAGVTLDAVTYTIPCCGNYTVNCTGLFGTTPIAAVPISTVLSGGQNSGVIFCPGAGAVITPSNSAICIGSSATLTAANAATYTWIASSPAGPVNQGTNNPLVVSPTVNTTYTVIGVTAQGCTISTTATVNVQSASVSVSPASQTMCAGSPVNFTANAVPVTGTNVSAGTTITGYQWFDPFGVALGTGTTLSTPAVGGVHTVVVTHAGAAGNCTVAANSTVVIGTSIPVTITPSSFSICPNGTVMLTATSIQTTASSYTWTQSNFPFPSSTFTGNPVTRTLSTVPRNFTVNVDYFGCPGVATFTVGLLTLTPTLTASSGLSSCPGKSITLTATGGITYTFSAIPIFPGVGTATNAIAKANASVNIVSHTPQGINFPIQYCVSSASAGCTGTTCITVTQRTLFPTLSLSSASVCPGTQFTLSSTTNGTNTAAGASYTFQSPFTPTLIASGSSTSIAYTPPPPGGTVLVPGQTYTVMVDSAGCTGSGTVTVNLLTLTPTLVASSPSICAGQQLTLTTMGAAMDYTFYASAPQFTNSSTSTSIVAGVSNTVTHTPPTGTSIVTYTVNVDSLGCKGSATYSIGILNLGPQFTLTSSAVSGSMCPGTILTVTATSTGASASNYSYTFLAPSPGSFTSAVNIGSVTVANPIPGTGITYTVQADSSTCSGTKTITVNEFKLNPSVVLSPTLVCRNMPVTITATNVNLPLNAGVSYSFYTAPIPPTGTASVGSGLGTFSVSHSPSAQAVYWVVVDSAGCTGPLIPNTATINIRPDLALVPSTSAASVCPGLGATLSVSGPTAATSITYTWSQSAGSGTMTPNSPASSPSVVVNPTVNATYTVNASDSLGCVGSTVINVGIDPTISFGMVLASSGSTICVPQSVNLSVTTAVTSQMPTGGVINYTWTPNSGLTPPTIASSVVAQPTITTVYTLTGSNGYGCVSQNTIVVPVGQIPDPSNGFTIIPSSSGVCVGFTSTLTAFGANSYTWTGTTFTGSIGQQSISVPPGSYTVLGSNGGGCTNTSTITISTLGNLLVNVTPVAGATTCIESNSPKFSQPVHLTASGAGSYVWFPYNPAYMTFSVGPQTDVRPPASTQYTVVGSTAICSGTAVVNVTVIPQFSMNVIPPLPAMCLGDSLKLSIVNISTMAVGPVSAWTYSWTEALNAPPISISSYFTPTVMVYPQNTTTYSVEVRDSRQCISLPRLVTVTVLPRPLTSIAIPTINNVATNTVCFVGLNPGAADVTINLTGNNTNTGLLFGVVPTYTWVSPYSPPYNSILTPPNSNVVTVNAPIRELNKSSVVTYTLISGYNGVQGCKRIDTVSIRVVDCRPVRSIKFSTSEPNDTICARSCVTFINQTDTMAGGPQKLFWTFKGGSPPTSTAAVQTVCYNVPGPYDVILRVSNPYPIADGGSTLTIGTLGYVKVVDVPNVTIIAPGQLHSDTIVRFGQSVSLKGSGALTYEWSPGYNITSLTKPNVTVNPFKTTQYVLTGYNSKHCASSDTINVIIIDDCGEMYVPNAFTPNNDGANDVLYVRGICLESLTFMVFDRWGEKVFETADQKIGWDGTYKGEAMNTGVFVYRLEGKTYDGKAFSTKGNITLLR